MSQKDQKSRKNSKAANLPALGLSLKNRFSWRRALRPFSSLRQQLQLPTEPPSTNNAPPAPLSSSLESPLVCISCGSSLDESSTRRCAAHSPAPCGCGQSGRSTTACGSTHRSQFEKKTKNVPSTIRESSESSAPSPPPLDPTRLYPNRYSQKRPARRQTIARRSSGTSSIGSRRSRVIYDPTVRSLLRDGMRPAPPRDDDDEDERAARAQLQFAFSSSLNSGDVDPRRLGLCRHGFRPNQRLGTPATPALTAHRHVRPSRPKIELLPPPPAPFALSLTLPPRRGVGVDFESHGYEFVSSLATGKAGVTYLVRSTRHSSTTSRSAGCPDVATALMAQSDLASFSRRILETSVMGAGVVDSSDEIEFNNNNNNNNNVLWVAKVIDLSRFSAAGAKQAELEAEYLKRLRHPFIVKYRESFVTSDSSLVIIMEYCEGGDLLSYLNALKKSKRSLSEERILQWISELALAIHYIHSKKIIHCDLKTSNIFISAGGQVKVGDFGISREIREGADCVSPVRIPRGTPIYMSPEMCRRTALTDRSDCWALGCILYEMCYLQYAFPIESIPAPLGSLTSYSAYITTADLISNIEVKLSKLSLEHPPAAATAAVPPAPPRATTPTSGRRSSLIRRLTRDLLRPSPDERPSLYNLLERLYLAEFSSDASSSSSVSSKGSGVSVPIWSSEVDDEDEPQSSTSLPAIYCTARQH